MAEFKPELSPFTSYLLSIPTEKIEAVLKGSLATELSPTLWSEQMMRSSLAAWVNDCLIEERVGIARIGSNSQEWTRQEYDPGSSSLYGSYCHYCQEALLPAESIQNFSRQLIELSQKILGWAVEKDRVKLASKTVRVIKGIRLRTTDEDHLPTVAEILDNSPCTKTGSNQ